MIVTITMIDNDFMNTLVAKRQRQSCMNAELVTKNTVKQFNVKIYTQYRKLKHKNMD